MTNQADEVCDEFAIEVDGQILSAWNSHDPERLVALADPGVVWEDPSIDGGRLVGYNALRAWLVETWASQPDLTFEPAGVVHIALDRRSAMAPWRSVGTMTGSYRGYAPTNQKVEASGVDAYWFHSGKLIHVRTAYDMLTVARQTCVLPVAGSRAERVGQLLQHLAARRARRRTR